MISILSIGVYENDEPSMYKLLCLSFNGLKIKGIAVEAIIASYGVRIGLSIPII